MVPGDDHQQAGGSAAWITAEVWLSGVELQAVPRLEPQALSRNREVELALQHIKHLLALVLVVAKLFAAPGRVKQLEG